MYTSIAYVAKIYEKSLENQVPLVGKNKLLFVSAKST